MTSAAKKSPLEDVTYSFPSFDAFQAFDYTATPGGTFLAGRPATPYRRPTNPPSGTTYEPFPAPGPTPAPSPAPSPPMAPPADSGPVDSGGPVLPVVPQPPPGQVPTDDQVPEVVITAPAPSVPSEASFPLLGIVAGQTVPVPRKPVRRPVRRRVPKPRPTPRRIRVPRLPPARIPIAVPEVLISAARVLPYAGLLTLVPDYLRVLGRIDQYGTQHTFDRMFPPIPGKKRDERTVSDPERPGNPDANPVGDTGDTVSLDDSLQPADVVYVTGTRPSPVAVASPVQLAPFRDAGYVYPPELGRYFKPTPSRATRPSSKLRINPDLFAAPSVGVQPRVLQQPSQSPRPRALPEPFAGPSPSPSPSPRPSPSPSPSPINSPLPHGAPSFGAPQIGSPLPGTSSGPLPLEHRCYCRTVDPNKKPRERERKKLEGIKPAEIEVQYKKFGTKVQIEGKAEKYCVKPPGQRRICFTSEEGLKLPSFKKRTPSVGRSAGTIIDKLLKLARRRK